MNFEFSVPRVNIILDLFALLVLTVIWFIDLKTNVEMKHKKLFRALMISCSTCLGADAVAYWASEFSDTYALYVNVFANCVYYVAQVFFVWIWFLYAYMRLTGHDEHYDHRISLLGILYSVPAVVEIILIVFINPFTGIIYSFDENNQYVRNDNGFFYYNLFFLYSYIVAATVMIFIQYLKEKDEREKTLLRSMCAASLTPIFASVFQALYFGLSIQWASTAFAIYMMYEIEGRYFLEKKQELQVALEKEINDNKISLMMSQIQPHFLYNTLTTIRALVGKNPSQAQDVITAFSTYLRTNMDSMNLTTPVPFIKELEHTKTYAAIEQLRFPDMQVVYDIQDKNFNLPALSIQPMVENAIKHGIRKRKLPGGCITIRSFFDGANHVVQIIDNGAGFKSDSPQDPSRSHIGVSNTKKRIEEMMHGAFLIDSEPDLGTTISFIIPGYTDDNDDEIFTVDE